MTVAGTATLNGAINLGNAAGDDITITGSLASSFPIKTNNSYDIGSATLGLRKLFMGNGGAGATCDIVSASHATTREYTIPDCGAAATFVMSTTAVPTVQKFTSSTGTYTTAAGAKWILVKMVGGGGGGGGSGTTGGGTGGTGGTSTFGTTLLSCVGGSGGTATQGGAGGTASIGAGIGTVLTGGGGGGGTFALTATGGPLSGGSGAATPLGGSGSGSYNGTGGSAGVTNTGSGGGGGSMSGATTGNNGGGGGAGGYILAIIASPGATYSYAVGAAGTAGSAGTSGIVGLAGGSGYIEVTEYYI